MNRLLTFSILLGLLFNCNRHYIREFKPTSTPSNLDKPYKIALVGFYPLQYSTVSSGQVITTTATLNYNNSTKDYFSYGKKIEEFPSSGIDPTVPTAKVKDFFLKYLSSVKRSGFEEIVKIVEIKGEGEKAEFHLKKRDIDYYVVAIHGPAFDSSFGNIGRFFATGHLFLATAGTSPLWSSIPANTQFLVYDNKLDFVGERMFENRYTVLTAWWGNSEEGLMNKKPNPEFTPKIFAPDVKEFSHEFPLWLKERTSKKVIIK